MIHVNYRVDGLGLQLGIVRVTEIVKKIVVRIMVVFTVQDFRRNRLRAKVVGTRE